MSINVPKQCEKKCDECIKCLTTSNTPFYENPNEIFSNSRKPYHVVNPLYNSKVKPNHVVNPLYNSKVKPNGYELGPPVIHNEHLYEEPDKENPYELGPPRLNNNKPPKLPQRKLITNANSQIKKFNLNNLEPTNLTTTLGGKYKPKTKLKNKKKQTKKKSKHYKSKK